MLSFEKELTPSNYEKRTSFFDKIKKFGDDLKKKLSCGKTYDSFFFCPQDKKISVACHFLPDTDI